MKCLHLDKLLPKQQIQKNYKELKITAYTVRANSQQDTDSQNPAATSEVPGAKAGICA